MRVKKRGGGILDRLPPEPKSINQAYISSVLIYSPYKRILRSETRRGRRGKGNNNNEKNIYSRLGVKNRVYVKVLIIYIFPAQIIDVGRRREKKEKRIKNNTKMGMKNEVPRSIINTLFL